MTEGEIMTDNEAGRKRLKFLIEELEKIRGRHTELVSVYVPQGFNLNKVVEQLRNEQGTASNIKSKAVRKNVLSALERALQHLKLYKQTPPNGLVLFSGNVSEKDGVDDVQIWAVEPPTPVKNRLYWCGQNFILDPLKEMVRETEVYGIILIEASESDIGMLSGKKITQLKHLDSLVPNKFAKGGWSANRFARVREGLLEDFMKKTAEIASSQFKEMKDLKGVIIGGGGPTKEMFAAADYLDYRVKQAIIGVVNTSYMGKPGLEEAVDKAEDLIAKASVVKEKKLLERFFGEFAKDSGLATYGLREVVDALKSGKVDILIVSEAFDWDNVSWQCSKCNFKEEKLLRKHDALSLKCSKCGANANVTQQKTVLDDILKLAEIAGSSIEYVSVDTPKGEQLKELGGIAAILRYKN
jgi:peptide chain release factor subunit 1